MPKKKLINYNLKTNIMLELAPSFVQEIDWKLLNKQKLFLINLDKTDETEGLINLIDAIQDYVVDVCELPDKLVYEFTV